MHTVTFEGRDFGAHPGTPGVTWTVRRMEWRAVGGPWSAELEAVPPCGDAPAPWRLLDLMHLLRCGVRISDELGLAWWGYVSAVTVEAGGQRVRVGLDEMANRVAVAYRRYSLSAQGGEGMVTGYEEDLDSIAQYGTKERIFGLGSASAAEAIAYARGVLRRAGRPVQRLQAAEPMAEGAARAWVECRGWWETLDWKYAREERGQIGLVKTGKAQPVGHAMETVRVVQRITPGAAGWYASEIWLRLQRVGLPVDRFWVQICAEYDGKPNWIMSQGYAAPGDVPAEMGWVRFVLEHRVWLEANTHYWLALARTGSINGAHYYQASVDEMLGYGGGMLRLTADGLNWVPRVPDADLCFQVVGEEETTESLRRLLAPGAAGQFLAGARITPISGVWTGLYRGGAERGRPAVERLLRMGISSGERLLAEVQPDRWARVTLQPPEPREESGLAVAQSGGRLARADGRPLAGSEQPAGKWLRLGALSGYRALRSVVFAEACAWTPARGVHLVEHS